MRPRTRRALVAIATSLGLAASFVGLAGAASAAKPAPSANCPSGDTTVAVMFDRTGAPQNVDPTVTVTGNSTTGTITADSSVLITGYVRVAGRVSDSSPVMLANPASSASYDNVGLANRKGKALKLTELDVCTTPNTVVTPPPTTSFTLNFSCYAATYTDRNWEFAWNYTGGTAPHTFDINYSDVETGLTETLTTPVDAGSTGGGTFEQANIGDHVTITVSVDGVDQPAFAFSGVVESTTTCAASMNAP